MGIRLNRHVKRRLVFALPLWAWRALSNYWQLPLGVFSNMRRTTKCSRSIMMLFIFLIFCLNKQKKLIHNIEVIRINYLFNSRKEEENVFLKGFKPLAYKDCSLFSASQRVRNRDTEWLSSWGTEFFDNCKHMICRDLFRYVNRIMNAN